MIRPLYEIKTGEFKGLEETIGLLSVSGDPDEIFFNYSFNEERSKVLYSVQKRHIPNVFFWAFLNKLRYELFINEKKNNLVYFTPSVPDRKGKKSVQK